MEKKDGSIFNTLIDSYLLDNIGIDNHFISQKLSTGLQEHLLHLQQNNYLLQAGIGNNIVKDEFQKMRSDKIYWLDKKNNNKYETQFLQHIEVFIKFLNSTCYTSINSYEFHYAVYDEGTFYKKHLDRFKNDSSRKFSLIHYLNDNWVAADGGELMLYQTNDTHTITPTAQKAVFFKSDEIEHEVLLTNKKRLSITGWLKSI
jgi:SM-20-related protein